MVMERRRLPTAMWSEGKDQWMLRGCRWTVSAVGWEWAAHLLLEDDLGHTHAILRKEPKAMEEELKHAVLMWMQRKAAKKNKDGRERIYTERLQKRLEDKRWT